MSNRTLNLTPPLYDYILAQSLREPALLADLRRETALRSDANMQISPEQGQFLAWLIVSLGVRHALEVGVYTGYSSLAVALALPPDGSLLAIDNDADVTSVARGYWQQAGVAARVELRLGDGVAELDKLLGAGRAGQFDFAFVDAAKTQYIDYYERLLTLLRPGGVIAVDNVLWDGKVADTAVDDEDTRAIRAFNRHVHNDTRVDLTMLPLADGLTLLRRR
jgi:caffeoyl-CoA O-methyltransferase